MTARRGRTSSRAASSGAPSASSAAASPSAGLGVTVGITVGGLLARDVAGTDSASGLGQTAGVLGRGRDRRPAGADQRPGRAAGGAGRRLRGRRPRRRAGRRRRGAVVPAAAPGRACSRFGAATACGLQARYAAADLAAPERRGRDLSLVVWATTIGSVLGPEPGRPGRRPRPPRSACLPLGGAFAVSAVGVRRSWRSASWSLLRPDPLLLARRLGGGGAGAPAPRARPARRVRAVWASPGGRLGLTAVVVSHAVMVGVMVMTPVHMGHAGGPEGTTLRIIGLVISVHVAGHVPLLAAGRPAGRPRRPADDGRRSAARPPAGRRGAGRHGAARAPPCSWARACCCSGWAGPAG